VEKKSLTRRGENGGEHTNFTETLGGGSDLTRERRRKRRSHVKNILRISERRGTQVKGKRKAVILEKGGEKFEMTAAFRGNETHGLSFIVATS